MPPGVPVDAHSRPLLDDRRVGGFGRGGLIGRALAGFTDMSQTWLTHVAHRTFRPAARGADENAKNGRVQKPLDKAVGQNRQVMGALLRKHGGTTGD